MTSADDVIAALGAWPYAVRSVTPLTGGWNSATWLVETVAGPYVAKLVDRSDATNFTRGLLVAEYAGAHGLVCGAPARTRTDCLTVSLHDGVLALLRLAQGATPNLSAPSEVRRAGRTLARAHRILRDCPEGQDSRARWPWVWVRRNLDELSMPTKVRKAARRAWDQAVLAVEKNELSVSLLHSDPGPHNFLLNTSHPARDALIDWSTALRGPLLYDLASFAVLTKSVPSAAPWFAEGYVAEVPQMAGELTDLNAVVKARWVAHAIYFSYRIEHGITCGAGSHSANEEGLADAYHGMTADAL